MFFVCFCFSATYVNGLILIDLKSVKKKKIFLHNLVIIKIITKDIIIIFLS